jgi:hypothetical protein
LSPHRNDGEHRGPRIARGGTLAAPRRVRCDEEPCDPSPSPVSG